MSGACGANYPEKSLGGFLVRLTGGGLIGEGGGEGEVYIRVGPVGASQLTC